LKTIKKIQIIIKNLKIKCTFTKVLGSVLRWSDIDIYVEQVSSMRVLKLVYMSGLISESACGVYSTFGSNTSKYPLKMPRPKSVRIFKGKLHAWYIKAWTPTVTDEPHDASTWVGTLATMLLRLCIPKRKILCGCYTKIV